MTTRHEVGLAIVAGVAGLIGANAVEAGLIRLTRGNVWDLAWTSDVVLAALIAVATYLWLHVRRLGMVLTTLERERVATETELLLAARIQRTLLENVAPPPRWLSWHAVTQPAGKVGGDLFDLVALDDHRALVLVGDVSGKGVGAAIGLAGARAAFRMITHSVDDPAEICNQWSHWLHEETRGMPYLTAVVALLDRHRETVRFVNAGHPPGLVLGPAGERLLEATAIPMGLEPRTEFRSEEIRWTDGATGLLVTDGVTEGLEHRGDPALVLSRMVRPLLASPVDALCDRLLRTARDASVGSLYPTDDWTIAAFRLT